MDEFAVILTEGGRESFSVKVVSIGKIVLRKRLPTPFGCGTAALGLTRETTPHERDLPIAVRKTIRP
jgi:hypothetical protein